MSGRRAGLAEWPALQEEASAGKHPSVGILYFGDDVSKPSVLWMRRMLEGLGNEVSTLVTESDPGPSYRQRFRTVIVGDGVISMMWWRMLRRLGAVASVPKSSKAVRLFARALESEEISAALVHYVTSAVAYRNVWRRSSKPIFVHAHGWDVTWGMREGPPPGKPV